MTFCGFFLLREWSPPAGKESPFRRFSLCSVSSPVKFSPRPYLSIPSYPILARPRSIPSFRPTKFTLSSVRMTHPFLFCSAISMFEKKLLFSVSLTAILTFAL